MTEQRMSGAAMIIKALADQGVEAMFGYPGGAVLPIYDEIFKHSDKIKHVLVRQEGGALLACQTAMVLDGSGQGAPWRRAQRACP